MIAIIMGVSGSGKTTVGKLLAADLGYGFVDADDYHSQASKDKMREGIPLDDSDRGPWLSQLREVIAEALQNEQNLVVACSALKESYRAILCQDDPRVRVLFLKVDQETAASRLAARRHEFMNPDLLVSQFETLEEPAGSAIPLDANEPLRSVLVQAKSVLSKPFRAPLA